MEHLGLMNSDNRDRFAEDMWYIMKTFRLTYKGLGYDECKVDIRSIIYSINKESFPKVALVITQCKLTAILFNNNINNIEFSEKESFHTGEAGILRSFIKLVKTALHKPPVLGGLGVTFRNTSTGKTKAQEARELNKKNKLWILPYL